MFRKLTDIRYIKTYVSIFTPAISLKVIICCFCSFTSFKHFHLLETTFNFMEAIKDMRKGENYSACGRKKQHHIIKALQCLFKHFYDEHLSQSPLQLPRFKLKFLRNIIIFGVVLFILMLTKSVTCSIQKKAKICTNKLKFFS